MADNRYQSKYSRITQDPAYQSVNPHMKKDLTIEEYYDLLHHTHEGMANADETNAKIEELQQVINELKNEITKIKVILDTNNDGVLDSNDNVGSSALYVDVDDT